MAQPLRFRVSHEHWDERRVRGDLLSPLEQNLGATMRRPWYALKGDYDARRFDMDNGDTALFAWGTDVGYWMGNTETPSALWQTGKVGFDAVPSPVGEWAERELLAELYETEPWIESYPHLATYFLPVLCSKDGRESTRRFFRDHAAGFPGTESEVALRFYDEFLGSGVLDAYRHEMAGKLGTSEHLDYTRMAAAMSEFTVAKLLSERGYGIEPEVAVSSGHSIDFKASKNGDGQLIEVTRPSRPENRRANTAHRALRETVATKSDGQLRRHGGGVTLFVDCSSFADAEWARVREDRVEVGHRPAVVFRVRPDAELDGYRLGRVGVDVLDR